MAYVKPRKVKAEAHLESIVHAEDLVNGQWVNLKEIDPENGDEIVLVDLAEEGGEAEALLVAVHVDYGYEGYNIAEQKLKAGKAGRAYVHEKGDHFSFSEDLVAGSLTEGDLVAVGANGLGVKKLEEGEVAVGKFIGTEFDATLGELFIVRIK